MAGVQGEQLRIVYKQPCGAATTANIADLAAGAPDTVDGVALSQDDRVLVKDQTTASENGIYRVSTVGTGSDGAWVRARDFDSSEPDSIQAGVSVYIQAGSTHAKKTFVLTTTGSLTVGSSSLTFEEGPTAGSGGSGTTAPTQTNAVYVSKAGNDSDSGLTKDAPKLTLASALTAASGLSPGVSNRVVIVIQDAGIYSENVSLSDYVSLNGREATVEGEIDLGLESVVRLSRIVSTTNGIDAQQAGDAWVYADHIETTGGSIYAAVTVNTAGTHLHLEVGRLEIAGAVGIWSRNSAVEITGSIGEIKITGAGWGIFSDGGSHDLHIGRLYETATATEGIDFSTGTPTGNLFIADFDVASTYQVDSGTLNLFVGTLTGTPGSVTATVNVTEAGNPTNVDQTNTVYVSKAGDDSNDGLSDGEPKLTIGSAITAASGLTPGAANRITIVVQDGGIYAESPTLPNYVSLEAPGAQIEGSVDPGVESTIRVHRIEQTGTGGVFGVNPSQTGECWLDIDEINLPNASSISAGIKIDSASSVVHARVGKITVNDGTGIWNDDGGTITGTVDEIEVTGSGWGFYLAGGTTAMRVDRLFENGGTATDGVDVRSSGTASLYIGEFDTTNSYNVLSGSTLNLFVGTLTGTPGSTAGTINLSEAGGAVTFTDETNVVYVSKVGSDSNDGLTLDRAKLTIGSAMTAASGLTPSASNRIEVRILDAGIYNENVTIPDYVSLVGPSATVTGSSTGRRITLGIESLVRLHKVESTGGTSTECIYGQEQGKAWVYVEEVDQQGAALSSYGIRTNNSDTDFVLNVGRITVGEGTAINESFSGQISGFVGEIEITSTGRGVYTDLSGKVNLHIGRIFDSGSATSAIDIDGPSTEASIFVGTIDTSTTYAVSNAGSTLSLVVGEVTGTTGTITGTAKVTVAGKTNSPSRKPVRAATTANVADLAAGAPDPVDGVSLAVGDRVLVKDQSTGSENGIYVVDTVGTGSNGAWSRATDFDDASDNVEGGLTFYVQEGSAAAEKTYTLTTTGSITVGSTSLTFEEVGGGGLGGSTGTTDEAVLLADGTGGSTVKTSDLTIGDIRDYSPVKRPCVAATGSDIADLAAGAPDTLDGVSLSASDRVLVWNQTTGSENGIYEVTTLGTGSNGTWSRTSDFTNATTDYIEAGVEVYVQQGDTFGRVKFLLTTTGAITIGSTSLEFIPMGGLVRTDASSTEIQASTTFTTSTKWTSTINMRDHNELAIWFDPTDLNTGGVTDVTIVIAWSDDGSTIAFSDGEYNQQTDFNITNQSDGSFLPKTYTANLTAAGGELSEGVGVHLSFPKRGGYCRIGVTANQNAVGAYTVRSQRLVV